MELRVIADEFSVCKVVDYTQVDLRQDYCFLGKTEEENSLVCPTGSVPANTMEREDGWRAFRIQGTLDFSLVGVLSRIASLLAENKISIFAISTYNTDYVLIKSECFGHALRVLQDHGYQIV